MSNELTAGVCCRKCGGPIYMETCDMTNNTGHDWTLASECQRCGARNIIESGCPQCAAVDRLTATTPKETT